MNITFVRLTVLRTAFYRNTLLEVIVSNESNIIGRFIDFSTGVIQPSRLQNQSFYKE